MADLWMDPRREDAILSQYRARQMQQQRARQAATVVAAQRVVELSRRAPNASNGLVTGAAVAGTDDEKFDQMAQRDSGESWFSRMVGGAASLVTTGASALYEQAIKPTIRGAFLLTETAAQELVQRPFVAASAAAFGDADSFGDAYRDYGNSAGVIAARNLLDDDPSTTLDLGTGFFAGGSVGQESFDQRTLQIDGQRANFGNATPTSRLVGTFVPPGNRAYSVVSGVTQFAADVLLDPIALLSGGTAIGAKAAVKVGASDNVARAIEGGLSGARKRANQLSAGDAAAALREAAGAVEGGGRQTVLVERATQMLKRPEVLEALAQADSATIWKSMQKTKARGLDARLLADLGDASTADEVADVLMGAVATGKVTEQGFYRGIGTFRRGAESVRLKVADSSMGGDAAFGMLSADDTLDAADKLDSWLRVTRVDDETRAGLFNEMLRVDDNEQMLDVLKRAMQAPKFAGTADETEALRKVSQALIDESGEYARLYVLDEMGGQYVAPHQKSRLVPKNGEQVEEFLPTPVMTAQLATQGFVLPDVVQARRAAERMTKVEKLYATKGWEVTADTARWITKDLFKPAAILRPAYIVRIGLEEQARLAAAGYDSLFNHPMRWLMANVKARDLNVDLMGGSLRERAEALHVINREATGTLDDLRRGRNGQQVWAPLVKGTDPNREFIGAWRREIAQLTSSPEARRLASTGGDLDDFVDWARNTSEGRSVIERMAKVNTKARGYLDDDDMLREWGDTLSKVLDNVSGGNRRILDAISDASALDDDFAKVLPDLFDSAPTKVRAEAALFDKTAKKKLDAAVDWLFLNITNKPTSYFARYPAFRQSIVRNLEETMDGLVDDAMRARAIDTMAENMSLTKDEIARLQRARRLAKGKEGLLDIDEMDELLVARAASETKDLLFDISKRSNAQVALEPIFPFLDAWKEVTETWMRLAKDNPAFFVKAQAGFQSLQEQGVIYANDFGQNVFAYPGGGAISSFFAGYSGAQAQGEGVLGGLAAGAESMLPGRGPDAQVTLEGTVEGANIVLQGVGPGFGPLVQWAVGAMPFMDERGAQDLRDLLAPFGTEVETATDLTDPSFYLDALAPAWFDKLQNAIRSGQPDPVQWNSTVGDTMKALIATGAYDPAKDQARLVEDAKQGARMLLLLRGAIQGTLITGPQAVWKYDTEANPSALPADYDPEADPDGRWHTLATLANEYRSLLDFYNYDEEMASTAFIGTYGIEPWYVGQAKSRSIKELPVTREGNFWIREREDVANEYASTIGFFVPIGEDTELDYSVYSSQMRRGDRQSLTGEQQLALANKAKAYTIFNAAKRRLEGRPSKARRDALASIRLALDEEYPGWRAEVLGLDSKKDNDDRIDELGRAVADPRLSDSPLTPPLRAYLSAREQINAIARARGAGLGAAQNTDLREALVTIGQTLRQEYDSPEFGALWTRVLSREVERND